MKKLDIDWLKRIQSIVNKLDRTTLKTNDTRCAKEVFIDRYFKFLEYKCFKLYIKDEIYYAIFMKSTWTIVPIKNDKFEYYSYGIEYHLGYGNHNYNIQFISEKSDTIRFKDIHWNDIIKIEYKEISLKDYINITNLFIKTNTNEKTK